MTLDKIGIGKTVVITKVNGQGELRLRLLDMGLIPSTKEKVQKKAPLGDPVELRLRGYELSLRVEDLEKIEVREVE